LIPQKSFGRALAIAGLLFIAVLTLLPQHSAPKLPLSLCLLCGDTPILDSLLNILLFIPFGMGMRLAGSSRRRAFAIALVTTITVEAAQLVIPGRDSSLGDVLTNSFGGFAGVLAADSWRVVLLPTRRQAAWLAGGWVLLWTVVLAASGALLHIALPRTTAWGVWEPALLQRTPFPGKVLGATAGGLPTPTAISGASADVRRRLSSDSVVVRATVVGGQATPRVAAIASVHDWRRSQIYLLGEREGNLVFSLRLRTADALISTPAIRLDDVFPSRPDAHPDTLRVAGGLVHHRFWISAERGGVRREWMLPADAGLGWSFFLPIEYEYGREAPWLTALWLAALAAPAAYWARRRGWRALSLAGVVMAAGLLIVPLMTRVHATPWWEWAGLAAGLAAGAALGVIIGRWQRG
jgi:hypothetical protein